MPLPKVTRYVRDGEVDPGVQEVAKAIVDSYAFYNVNWASYGLSADAVRYEIEKLAYFVASSGFGIFVGKPFTLEGGAGEWAKETGRGPYVLRKYSDRVVPEDVYALTSPWEDWFLSQHPDLSLAEKKYRRLFENEPDGEMIAEALLFFDPSGAYGDDLRKVEDPVAEGRQTAMKVASGVPPLGRKWLTALMVSSGVKADTARMRAFEVYDKGGNLLGWAKFDERKEAVRSILAKFDPQVSDEQVEVVAKSPVPLAAIEATFSSIGSRSSGTRSTSEPGSEATATSGGSSLMWLGVAALAAGGIYLWKKNAR